MKSRTDARSSGKAEPMFEGDDRPRPHWRRWAEALHQHGLDGIVAWMLDAGRPLALLSAQLLYAGRPFLGTEADRLANLLESEDEACAFGHYLDSQVQVGRATHEEIR